MSPQPRTWQIAAVLALAAPPVLAACSHGDGTSSESAPGPVAASSSAPSDPPSGDPSPSASDPSAASAQELPPIGRGDPMLGDTDGIDRPQLADIRTEDLDATNATEQAEHVRRILTDGGTEQAAWMSQIQGVSDPTFAASVAVSDRQFLVSHEATSIRVARGYVLGSANGPYASFTGQDSEGSTLWTLRLAFYANQADPSVGTWKAISLDWPDEAETDRVAAPLTESGRSDLRTTASFASAPLFAQEIGETPQTRAASMSRYFQSPVVASTLPAPFPDRNVRALAGDPTGTYFVTPQGSGEIWIEVDNSSREVSQDGQVSGDTVGSTVYVRLTFDGDTWVAVDAQKKP